MDQRMMVLLLLLLQLVMVMGVVGMLQWTTGCRQQGRIIGMV